MLSLRERPANAARSRRRSRVLWALAGEQGPDNRQVEQLPPQVVRANELARELGFPLTREEAGPGQPSACLPGTGRFLAVLAAGCRNGRIGEIGTGAGIGTAWMASAMPADCTLVTVEVDQRLAAAVAGLMAADHKVEVLAGDA